MKIELCRRCGGGCAEGDVYCSHECMKDAKSVRIEEITVATRASVKKIMARSEVPIHLRRAQAAGVVAAAQAEVSMVCRARPAPAGGQTVGINWARVGADSTDGAGKANGADV